jgi:hypothetical protein
VQLGVVLYEFDKENIMNVSVSQTSPFYTKVAQVSLPASHVQIVWNFHSDLIKEKQLTPGNNDVNLRSAVL